MKKNGVLLFIVLWGALSIICAYSVLAQTPEQIYQEGKRAFDNDDYLRAVKRLFAYQKMVQSNLDQNLNKRINSAIRYCDEQISLAIRTKEDLDRHGHITELVIESSGKTDDFQSRKGKVKYRQPTGKYVPRPSLPVSVPKGPSAKKSSTYVMKQATIITPDKKKHKADSKTKVGVSDAQLVEIRKKYEKLLAKYKSLSKNHFYLRKDYEQLLQKYKASRGN